MDLALLKYTKTHEWVCVDGDVVTIGITDFAVDLLTDLVYLGLPETGTSVDAGDTLGEIESVKAVSDLYSPFSGEVIESNAVLIDDLDALSDDPFGNGWLIKLKVSDASAAEGLLDRTAYEAHCAAEAD